MQNIVMLPLDRLHPHPANPRKDLGDLTELADAIKAKGILQNLTVVPYYSQVHKRTMDGLYTVIIGHRRMAAAKLAGLTEVPCVIANMTDKEQLETMMVENVQRSDLTVYEQAEGFQLMLDMGSTVAEVAHKVGLSESTVRGRAKLAALDKQKFKKGEERGATLGDFLKLHNIADEKRRDEVLEAIGTPNFNQKYNAAIQMEKNEKWMADTIEALRNADWCEEITKEQRDQLAPKMISYQYNYGTWNKRKVEKPADADRLNWFFCVCRGQVDMYREIDTTVKIDPQAEKRRLVAEEIDDLMAECREMEQGFRDLREDFITEFDAFNTYREEIVAFAVKAWLRMDTPDRYYGPLVDKEELANMLGIGYDETKNLPDQKGMEHQLRSQPERVLLYTAYLSMENGKRGWLTRLYDNTVMTNLPKHREDERTDLLYECLRSLGYAWSTEEQKASVGDLPQFQQAERLCREYNEEVKGDG